MERYDYKVTCPDGTVEYEDVKGCAVLMQCIGSEWSSLEENLDVVCGNWAKLHIGGDDERYTIERLEDPLYSHPDIGLASMQEIDEYDADTADMEETYACLTRNPA